MINLCCYDPASRFPPQWLYPPPPAGYFEDPYFVPFSITLTGSTNPVYRIPIQLDDDYVFLARTLIFPAAGINIPVLVNPPDTGVPLLLRLWDTRGNPLSNDLALAFGVACQSGFGNNMYGFPFAHQVTCDPGGLMQVDFQAPAIGGPGNPFAVVTDIISGESITFTSLSSATYVIFVGALVTPNSPLTVNVVGTQINILLATDGADLVTTTYAQLAAFLNSDPSTSGLIHTTISGPAPNSVVPGNLGGELGIPLSGGTLATVLTGYLYGVRLRKVC